MTVEISWLQLSWASLLLILPLLLSFVFKLGLTGDIVVAAVRMAVQLALVGFFLEYIFEWQNTWLTLGWFLLMVFSATATVLKQSQIRMRKLLLPVLGSFIVTSLLAVVYMNLFILRLESFWYPRYFIVLTGMVLGNSLRANIVGITSFYQSLRRERNRFEYHLAAGATLFEAIRPYFAKSLKKAFAPTVATMATMGIVSLPGMMTGQILGGADPLMAVRYQMLIMAAIFFSISLGTSSTLLLSVPAAFTKSGVLRISVFRNTEY